MLLALIFVPALLLGSGQIVLDRERLEWLSRLPRAAFRESQFAGSAVAGSSRDEPDCWVADALGIRIFTVVCNYRKRLAVKGLNLPEITRTAVLGKLDDEKILRSTVETQVR